MTVADAIALLKLLPGDAALVICAHEFPGGEGQGWPVLRFDFHPPIGQFADGVALVEGAMPFEPESGDDDDNEGEDEDA